MRPLSAIVGGPSSTDHHHMVFPTVRFWSNQNACGLNASPTLLQPGPVSHEKHTDCYAPPLCGVVPEGAPWAHDASSA